MTDTDAPGDRRVKLKGEHLIVLAMLERVNEQRNRAVGSSEVLESLTSEQRGTLDEAYTRSVRRSVSKILRQLLNRGIVLSPGKRGRTRFYFSPRVLDPEETELPQLRSRRQRSLAFVTELVCDRGLAVRCVDIEEAANSGSYDVDVPTHLLLRDVQNLRHTGDLVVVDEVRGDGGGTNLYLPAELADRKAAFLPDAPQTWLEQLWSVFRMVWGTHVGDAEWFGRLPLAVTTGQVRERFQDEFPDHPRLEDPQLLINGLRQLTRGERPYLRKIDRTNQRSVFWVPATIGDEQVRIEGVYAHDTERMGEAARRAHERINRPAVRVADCLFEIERDFALELRGDSPARNVLFDMAKKTVDDGQGGRSARRDQVIRHVGTIDNTAYFSARDGEAAERYVEGLALEHEWAQADVNRRLSELSTCTLPSVAWGRLLLLQDELVSFHERTHALLASDHLPSDLAQRLRGIADSMAELEDLAAKAAEDVEAEPWWPDDVDTEVPGWTPEELYDFLVPHYPAAEAVSEAHKLVPLLEDRIRRVPNPSFTSRFDNDHDRASEHLFDRLSALLYAANRWGSDEATLQATLAAHELGHLRDVNFLLPGLESEHYAQRLTAVAGLAFLADERALPHLERLVQRDPDQGVRESARWAHSFVSRGVLRPDQAQAS